MRLFLGSNKSSAAVVLGPNRSDEAASTVADDDLLKLKLVQTHVALISPTRQQVLQLMMTCS